MTRFSFSLLTLLLVACDDGGPVLAGPPAALQIVSGDAQDVFAGEELPDPLVVRVVDSTGNPVPGQVVNFVVVSGGGNVFAGTGLTNADGLAQERWIVGTSSVEAQRVEVRAVDPATGAPLVFAVFRAELAGPRLVDVRMGQSIACGLGVDSLAYCWGRNRYGAIGVGTATDTCNGDPCSRTAVAVSGDHRFVDLAVGWTYFACGVTDQGEVYCWGTARRGQLGDGRFDSTAVTFTPVRAQVPIPVVDVEAGGDHACARAASGAAYCWGWNGLGQLGDGTTADRALPVQVGDTITFAQLALSDAHTCGLAVEGRLWCWGSNHFGQLGRDPAETQDACLHIFAAGDFCSHVPVAVQGGLLFTSVTVAQDVGMTCGLTASGSALCWGMGDVFGSFPELRVTMCPGNNQSRDCAIAPTQIATPGGVAAVRISGIMGCVLLTDGTAFCRSPGHGGRLGNGTAGLSSTLVPVAGGHVFAQLTVGEEGACGIDAEQRARCWGAANDLGRLGVGEAGAVLVPARVIF